MRLSSLIYATVFASLATSSLAQEDEGINRWRLMDDDGQSETISLVEAASSATDALGQFRFYCKRHSGTVHVIMWLNDQDRVEVGGLLVTNEYPRFEFLPDTGFDRTTISMSDSDGWEMAFDIDASSKFLDLFGQTGELRYRLVKDVRGYMLEAGKEVIPTFVKSCSHE